MSLLPRGSFRVRLYLEKTNRKRKVNTKSEMSVLGVSGNPSERLMTQDVKTLTQEIGMDFCHGYPFLFCRKDG